MTTQQLLEDLKAKISNTDKSYKSVMSIIARGHTNLTNRQQIYLTAVHQRITTGKDSGYLPMHAIPASDELDALFSKAYHGDRFIQSIFDWYLKRGFLTLRQHETLVQYVNNYPAWKKV